MQESMHGPDGVSRRGSSLPGPWSGVSHQLVKALEFLRAGDVLVITKLDPLGRSVCHLIDLAETLNNRNRPPRTRQGTDSPRSPSSKPP